MKNEFPVRRVPLCVLVLVGVLLAAAHVPSCIKNKSEPDVFKPRVLPDGDVVPPAVPEPDHSADIQRFNAEVAEALNRHLAVLADLARNAITGFLERGPFRFDPARNAIPGIRESFDGYGAMIGVVKDGAMDKVFGGDRLEERFSRALDVPFIQPCARAGASLIDDFDAFRARLEAETEAFRQEIGAAHSRLPDDVRADFPVETLQQGMNAAFNELRWMPIRAGAVSAATAIEAATIRSTAAAAKRLALRYGAKAIGKAAAGAGAAAADGPAPFFDALGVVLALWSAYDVYDLQNVLPRKIEKSLTSAVDQMQSQTISMVSAAAKKAHKAYAETAKDIARSACAEATATIR